VIALEIFGLISTGVVKDYSTYKKLFILELVFFFKLFNEIKVKLYLWQDQLSTLT
jgi:hypothetical protein